MTFLKTPEQKAAEKVYNYIEKYRIDYRAFISSDYYLQTAFKPSVIQYHNYIDKNLARAFTIVIDGFRQLDDEVRSIRKISRDFLDQATGKGSIYSRPTNYLQQIKNYLANALQDAKLVESKNKPIYFNFSKVDYNTRYKILSLKGQQLIKSLEDLVESVKVFDKLY